MLCNCSAHADPAAELSPSLLNRALLIDRLLAPSGIRVFLYSPGDVTAAGAVAGYTVDGHDLVAAEHPVPRVNANWTYGTRRLIDRGMGYRRFKRWTRENGIEIYVPYAFSELVSNKLKAYAVVREHDAQLHPHTENLTGSTRQIDEFVERSGMAFVKPRAGNKGNRIFVVRRIPEGHSLTYYEDAAKRLFSPISLEAALGMIEVAAARKRYVVQEGVESLRYEGSVFDVRVVMVHDASRWHSILETRLAPRESDLSNVFQGGSIQVTEELLDVLLGESAGRQLAGRIRSVSHRVAEHLERDFPSALMELGLDFVLDRDLGLHLVEVNAKPGVAGFGSETRIFDWKAEDELHYERWLRPHVEHLAAFLRAKVEAA